ncbi:CHAP domain-containing protein [Candidatus Hydrogenedentota bacterium]
MTMITKRQNLVRIAEKLALKPFHDKMMGLSSNIELITDHFPEGPRAEFDGKWCAAFVYHCCVQAGFEIPYRHPTKAFGTFAGVRAWLQWAKLQENRFYFSSRNSRCNPESGDIVIYDHVFDPGPHDHMGIVLAASDEALRVAEGNVHGISAVVERTRNSHIRGYIRIPNNYRHGPINSSVGRPKIGRSG